MSFPYSYVPLYAHEDIWGEHCIFRAKMLHSSGKLPQEANRLHGSPGKENWSLQGGERGHKEKEAADWAHVIGVDCQALSLVSR
jgi:hypothetical protein